MDFSEIFRHVDHTALAAACTWPEVQKLCGEAAEQQMASVCIPPSFVKRAKQEYEDRVAICTVIGFPLGYTTTQTKLFEAKEALANGADEIDMVVNLGRVKAGDYDAVTEEILLLKEAAGDKILKVIVETCYLTDEEKEGLCHCVTRAGADYIKTSTGFGTGGAAIEDIELFKKHIGPKVKMKASGGIRSYEDFVAYLNAGCERLGTSSAMKVFGKVSDSDEAY